MPTAAQDKLIADITAALEKDARIEAAWLAGSLGRGQGDAFSDVDVLVLCAEGRGAEVAAAYADPSAIAKAVLVNLLYGGRIVNVVTEAWQRFDLSFIEEAQLGMYDSAALSPLFNRSGREPPRAVRQPYAATPDAVRRLVNEFYRILGLAPVGIGRGEYLVSLSGVELLRRLAIDLMMEENGIGPAERGGALHVNTLLTAEQRSELEGLPPVAADRDSLLTADKALAAVFLPRARALAAKIGMAWPDSLEQATRRHLKAELGLEI
jgi:predicted nucleotidyltransferase